MTGSELFSEFRLLPEAEREDFLRLLAIWIDLNLPDGDKMLISIDEIVRMRREGAA